MDHVYWGGESSVWRPVYLEYVFYGNHNITFSLVLRSKFGGRLFFTNRVNSYETARLTRNQITATSTPLEIISAPLENTMGIQGIRAARATRLQYLDISAPPRFKRGELSRIKYSLISSLLLLCCC